MKKNFFVTPKSNQISHFTPNTGTLHSTLQLGQNFYFWTKMKTSKAHSFVSTKNKQTRKRNFFLCHTQIYPSITIYPNFSELFIPPFNFVKILIFFQKQKLQILIGPSIPKLTISEEEPFSLSYKSAPKNHIIFFNFSQIFVPFFDLTKILIFLQ